MTKLQFRSLSFILFSCPYSILLHFLAKVLCCATSYLSLTHFHMMRGLSVKSSDWQRITKTYFPRWLMLGYIWPFIMPAVLPKTLKGDIWSHENYFSIIAIPVTWLLMVPPLCFLDSFPPILPSTLLLLLPCFSCLYFPSLQLEQLMQKSARLCSVINGSQFWWLIAYASFNHASFICYWIIWKWHLWLTV